MTAAPCFPAGTPIATEDGVVAIEQLERGTRVYSYDRQTGSVVLRPMERLRPTGDEPVGRVQLANGTALTLTGNHPVYLAAARRYVPARKLRVGDKVLRMDDAAPTMSVDPADVVLHAERVTHVDFTADARVPVYNFAVPGTVSYFAHGVLVHNY